MTLRSQGASVFIHLSPTVKPAKTKRTPFALKKDSFYSPKGLVLHFKRTPFATQKDYISSTTEFRAKTNRRMMGANVINKANPQSITNNNIRQKVFQISNLLYVLWNSNTYVQKIVVPLHTYYIYNNEIEINNNYVYRLPVHNG